MDADDTRRAHLRVVLRDRRAWLQSSIVAVVGFGIGFFAFGIVGAVILAAVVIGFSLWNRAGSLAAEEFYAAYSKSRGLERLTGYEIPPVTELLRRGDRRYTGEALKGTLPGGLAGILGHYTFVNISRDSEGRRRENHVPFTVALFDLPAEHPVPEISLTGGSIFGGLIDAFSSKDRVELESEAFNQRYDLYLEKGHDLNWLRQLFSPSFIVELTASPLYSLGFELEGKTLCVYDSGKKADAGSLDRHAAGACAIATRVLREVSEGVPVDAAPQRSAAPPLPPGYSAPPPPPSGAPPPPPPG